ncbi:MAG TPA: PaaI family thioesterase [Verrucomicrobiae bacterium]|nr:PaaI family thioesterase [Verrucomicrobiae bacterium]
MSRRVKPIALAAKRRPKSQARASIEELRARLKASNTAKQFAFELANAGYGRVVMQMRVGHQHRQLHGVVHGGVMAALVDTAGGMATYMALPRGARSATIELKINYLEGVVGGVVAADARVVRMGRHIAVVDCDVHDQDGRLVAKALMTFFVGPFRKKRKG